MRLTVQGTLSGRGGEREERERERDVHRTKTTPVARTFGTRRHEGGEGQTAAAAPPPPPWESIRQSSLSEKAISNGMRERERER